MEKMQRLVAVKVGVENGRDRVKAKAGSPTGSTTGSKADREGSGGEEAGIGVAEHLTRDLARVRAKFGMDPVPALRSLAAAWQSGTLLEEDEAEFVDTVADCLGAGLCLDDALTCWDTGDLACDDAGEEQGAADAEDDGVFLPAHQIPVARTASGGHRVLVR